jgi:hypothetical protein
MSIALAACSEGHEAASRLGDGAYCTAPTLSASWVQRWMLYAPSQAWANPVTMLCTVEQLSTTVVIKCEP